MMPLAYSALGTLLTVTIPGVGTRKAKVVPRPFVDPGKEIPKT
jgi:glycine cleavage system aminomethyltransferase T